MKTKIKVLNGKEQFKNLIEDKFIAIHCSTKEQSNEYCVVMDALGKTWTGGSYLEYSNWEYGTETCYNPRFNSYCSVKFYEEESKEFDSNFFGIVVVEWEQVKLYCNLIFEEEEVVEMTLEQICKALGKNVKIVK